MILRAVRLLANTRRRRLPRSRIAAPPVPLAPDLLHQSPDCDGCVVVVGRDETRSLRVDGIDQCNLDLPVPVAVAVANACIAVKIAQAPATYRYCLHRCSGVTDDGDDDYARTLTEDRVSRGPA